jgi:hypothetical protein
MNPPRRAFARILVGGRRGLWSGVPKTELPKQNITMGELGPLGSDGLLWRVLPNGATREITPTAGGVDFYTFLPRHTKYGLTNVCHAPVPADRQRTTVGVGEEVDISFPTLPADIPVAWRTTAGGLSATNGKGITFTAPSNGVPATVTATVKGQTCPIDFSVLEPSGVDHAEFVEYDTVHVSSGAGAGMHIRPYVGPTNVSFYHVQIMEVGEPASNVEGYFTLPSHPPPSHSGNGADEWISLDYDNHWLGSYDWAYSFGWPSPWQGGTFSGGSYVWDIPFRWRIKDDRQEHLVTDGWNQIHTLFPNGTMSVTKFGHAVTRTIGGDYSGAW